MHLFLKTLYMLLVMVTTAMMMVAVLLSTPDIHSRLSSGGLYRHADLSYSQLVMQSLDNPGVYVVEVKRGEGEEDEEEEERKVRERREAALRAPAKREAAWNYSGNNTGYLKIYLDYGRPQHEPWAGRTGCSGLRVGFARRQTLPRTALASFPGSGNTWLRYLLQGATGLFTGSVYLDRELATRGFYGENETPECGCTVVVKTHGYCLRGLPQERDQRAKDMERFYGRGLLLLRNPYDTLLAYRNYLTAGHLGVAGPAAFRGAEWARFVRGQTELWRHYAMDWLSQGRNVLVVHYEQLLRDPRRELLRILQFLHVRPDDRRLHCVLDNLDGSFRRPTPDNAPYRLRDPFTPELHEEVEAAVQEVNAALGGPDRPHLPIHLYSYQHLHHHNHHHHHHHHKHHTHHNLTAGRDRDSTGQSSGGGEREKGDSKAAQSPAYSANVIKEKNKRSVAKSLKSDESGNKSLNARGVVRLSPWMKAR